MACSKPVISDSVNKFTFDVYRRIVSAKPGDNAFMSTTSVMVVMAMIHIGAKGDTEKQMAKVLALENMNRATLLSELKRFVGILLESGQSVTLRTANRLYPDIKRHILEDYIKLIRQHFKADVKGMDYLTKADESRLEINAWVENETNGKIKDLLPSGCITDLTAMVVVNAIYFKGNWDEQFNPAYTHKADFYVTKETKIQTDMMDKTFKNVKYAHSEEFACKILAIPYIGGDLCMVILLPDDNDGLPALETHVSPGMLKNIMDAMHKQKVIVNLPKFKLEAGYQMKDVLSSLGMSDLFGTNADLSGMCENLYVSQVFHKAFVDVNEEGTEAAAATAAFMMLSCTPTVRPTTFIADHPFLFMIWDHRIDTPLFIGRLANPN